MLHQKNLEASDYIQMCPLKLSSNFFDIYIFYHTKFYIAIHFYSINVTFLTFRVSCMDKDMEYFTSSSISSEANPS